MIILSCFFLRYWHITELMLTALASNKDAFDVIVVDDHSERVNITDKAMQLGVHVLRNTATSPQGNTHTWNAAWKVGMKPMPHTPLHQHAFLRDLCVQHAWPNTQTHARA